MIRKGTGGLLCGLFLILGFPGEGRAKPAPRIPVEVKVEVAEVDHAKAARVGVDWLDKIEFVERRPAGVSSLGSFVRATPIRAELNFLVEEGAAELLANPNLITDSGTTASFHAGGQIPYITVNSLGSSNVEFKPYGVSMKVRPDVREGGQIEMAIEASISAPDQTNGVVFSGNTVPAILSREVATHVTVEPGTTTTLAGLVQSVKEKTVQGVPFLRRIPLLGIFFRWKREESRRSTIVMFVTPDFANK